MKKQVMKLLRLAKKDGDREAGKLLAHIQNNDLMKYPVVYFNSCENITYFNWHVVRIAYDGHADEITVFWGDHRWTLCN